MNLPGLELPGDLLVAPNLSLPHDTEGHRIGILGTSGAGKTSVAKGLGRLGRNIPPEPRTTEDVLTLWSPALSGKELEILRLLVSLHPKGITAQGLAARVNLTHGAGTFGKYLGTLRANRLINTTPTGVFASDMLFPK